MEQVHLHLTPDLQSAVTGVLYWPLLLAIFLLPPFKPSLLAGLCSRAGRLRLS